MAAQGSHFLTAEGWSVGGGIGLDSGALRAVSSDAGFSASYTSETTTGNEAGVNAPCGNGEPGNYTCGLHIRPQCEHIKGTCEHPRGARIPCKLIRRTIDVVCFAHALTPRCS